MAAGAIAKQVLLQQGIEITAYTKAVGAIEAETVDLSVIESNIVRCPDVSKVDEMVAYIEKARAEGDSVGGIVEAVVKGCCGAWRSGF